MRRINVDSGRPLEAKAHYSRALRAGSTVLQSGTTAIDRQGNILGDTIGAQIDAIFAIAKETMDAADGGFADLVRARLYVVGADNLLAARAHVESKLAPNVPVISVIPVSRLARPTQLIEIELEAIDEAAQTCERFALSAADSESAGVLKHGDLILVDSMACASSDGAFELDSWLANCELALRAADAGLNDVVSIRIFYQAPQARDKLNDRLAQIFENTGPCISLLHVPPFGTAQTEVTIEVEARRNARESAVRVPHPQLHGFAESLRLGQEIYLSQIEPLDDRGAVVAANDWGAQRDYCSEKLDRILRRADSHIGDVIVRRFFTRVDAVHNREYGEGRAWFAASRPAALGCRIAGHASPGIELTLEARAVNGASEKIEWRQCGERS